MMRCARSRVAQIFATESEGGFQRWPTTAEPPDAVALQNLSQGDPSDRAAGSHRAGRSGKPKAKKILFATLQLRITDVSVGY